MIHSNLDLLHVRIRQEDIKIVHATLELADDWTFVFLKGMNSHRWMSRYLRDQNISKVDVKLSFEEDVRNKTQGELFLIAYVDEVPVGIIRAEEYWLSNANKILSHFPLVRPRYQRKGIGEQLVKYLILQAKKERYQYHWAECWSKDKREIQTYKSFYEKIGFTLKSDRLEMVCELEKIESDLVFKAPKLETITTLSLTNEFINILSKSYAISKDNLHSIENLGNRQICKEFLLKTQRTFEKSGYRIEYQIAKYRGEFCAALMMGISKKNGMVLEIGILPKYRKKNIAKKLIIDFLIAMKNKGLSEIRLGVDAENTPALNLYDRLHFEKSWYGAMFLLEDTTKLLENKES